MQKFANPPNLTATKFTRYMVLLFFFTICRRTYQMHRQCYGSEIFSNTIVLLKVGCFKGFSYWSNIDKLMINSMSGCNYKNYKLNNNNYKLKSSLA